METQEHIDDLIGKVLTGEASEQEQAQVEAWRSQRAANEQYFVQCRQILEEAGRAPEFHYDERAAWERVKSTMHAGSRSRSFPVWRVAAAVAVVALAGYAISRWYVEPIQQLSLRSEHAITTDTLPDGSVAVMNRQTRIEYAEARTDNQRRVKLTGEAYFDVRHLEEKPFVIETAEEVLIRDIGTSFNVRAFPGSDTVEVFVESGEVQFYTLRNPGLKLRAGETGIYNKSLKEFTRLSRQDPNAIAYKTKIFSFNNTELRVAVNMLNEVYESHIALRNPDVGNCRLTVNFHNDRIEDIADIIAETLNLTVEKKNDIFMLNGEGCPQ